MTIPIKKEFRLKGDAPEKSENVQVMANLVVECEVLPADGDQLVTCNFEDGSGKPLANGAGVLTPKAKDSFVRLSEIVNTRAAGFETALVQCDLK